MVTFLVGHWLLSKPDFCLVEMLRQSEEDPADRAPSSGPVLWAPVLWQVLGAADELEPVKQQVSCSEPTLEGKVLLCRAQPQVRIPSLLAPLSPIVMVLKAPQCEWHMDKTLVGSGFPLTILDFALFPKIKEHHYHLEDQALPVMKPLPMEAQSMTRGKAEGPACTWLEDALGSMWGVICLLSWLCFLLFIFLIGHSHMLLN